MKWEEIIKLGNKLGIRKWEVFGKLIKYLIRVIIIFKEEK